MRFKLWPLEFAIDEVDPGLFVFVMFGLIIICGSLVSIVNIIYGG